MDILKLPKSLNFSETKELVLSRADLDERALRNMIRDMGIKVTGQRLLILKALHEGRVHVTAQEIYEIVNQKDSTIGFATVYRFLRALTKQGLVTEVRMGGLAARYELKPAGHHDHLTCVKCGKICEFEDSQIENLQERVAKKFGFQLTGHVLELYGICPDCREK